MSRRSILPFLLLALLSCRPDPAQQAPVEPDNIANLSSEPLPEADINASLEPISGNGNRQAAGPLRFVGNWAAETRLCPRNAWRFTAHELTTPAGSVCRFGEVREVPGGYDISARCTAEAPERDDVLRLRFPQLAGCMLLESDNISDVGLILCPV